MVVFVDPGLFFFSSTFALVRGCKREEGKSIKTTKNGISQNPGRLLLLAVLRCNHRNL